MTTTSDPTITTPSTMTAEAPSITAQTTPHPALPPPFSTSETSLELIAQGAESLLYRTVFLTPTTPAALKIRPKKSWRHPTLDKRLTRARILAEARVLVKLSGEGIAVPPTRGGKKVKVAEGAGQLRGAVPKVLGLDWEAGWLCLEWIEGGSVKEAIYQRNRNRDQDDDGVKEEWLTQLLRKIGRVVGRLHAAGVVHGDLTTSNLMLRPTRPARPSETGDGEGDIILIDFGLSTQSSSDEDRAVDLYVLERAFGSTHPREEEHFPAVLEGYREVMGDKVLRRLEDVRMRGRKKSMLG